MKTHMNTRLDSPINSHTNRRKRQGAVHATARLAVLACFAVGGACAQVMPPDAGQILRQTTQPVMPAPAPVLPGITQEPPAAAAPAGERIEVRSFRITGNTAFTPDQLLPLLDGARGSSLTLAELDALALRITRHYRDAGYLLARAYLPPQDVRDGLVTIDVLEGRLGQVETRNLAGLSGSALAPLSQLADGQLVSRGPLEGSLLALSDLPGVEVKSTLRPGAAVGTSDLLVEVAPGRAFTGSADLDSYGNRYTGQYRLGATLSWNNPASLGDQASLRAQGNDQGFAYLRLGYQLPLGARATRVGVAASHMRYELGGGFAPLAASGEATVFSLHARHPLVRTRDTSWFLQAQYDDKALQDRIASTAMRSSKTLRNWTFGVSGDLSDDWGGGGASRLALSATLGQLTLDAASALADQGTARTQGHFSRWLLSLERQQLLGARFSLAGSYSAQRAGQNLDSSEKFALGGALGVRAYPQGEAAGDHGQLISVELRHQVNAQWQLQGFYDDGRVAVNHSPWAAGANRRHLAGYGLGVGYAAAGVSLRLAAAWKAGSAAPTSDTDRSPRLWFQAAVAF